MSAIEKAAAMLRHEAESLKACHTLDGDWCGDPAEADYHEMIAAADAAIAERDELRTELNEIRYGVAVAHDTIKALRAKIERMERDLRLIAETDPVDAALDPQRAVRIARATLEESK